MFTLATSRTALHGLMVLSTTALAGAKSDQVLFQDEQKESIVIRTDKESGRVVTDMKEIKFERVEGFDNGKDHQRTMLARTTKVSRIDEGLEGTQSKLTVDFFLGGENFKNFPSKPTNNIEIPNAHEVHFKRDHWQASTWGCCGAELYSRIYSYESNTPIMRFNEDYWKLEIPNAKDVRFVGLLLRAHTSVEAAEKAVFGNYPEAVACLTYAGLKGEMQSVYLQPKTKESTQPLALNTAELKIIPSSKKDEVNERDHAVWLWSADKLNNPENTAPKFANLKIQAAVYTDDATETLTVSLQNDKLTDPVVEGSILKVSFAKD